MKTYTSLAKKLNITYYRCHYVLKQLDLTPNKVNAISINSIKF